MPEYARLRSAITERLNAHDLLGVLQVIQNGFVQY